jgi:hypothetical protein
MSSPPPSSSPPSSPPQKPAPLPPLQSETLFTSAMAKAGEDARHSDSDAPDAVERLAARTGRILGFIALPGLAWLFGRQLGWW